MAAARLKAVSLRLDEPDVEEQKKYLASILHQVKASGEGIRFQYDLEGQSHWDGLFFLLETGPICYLRMAKKMDVGLLDPATSHALRHLRQARNDGLSPQDASFFNAFEVSLEKSLNELTVDDLHAAICCFIINDVMSS